MAFLRVAIGCYRGLHVLKTVGGCKQVSDSKNWGIVREGVAYTSHLYQESRLRLRDLSSICLVESSSMTDASLGPKVCGLGFRG